MRTKLSCAVAVATLLATTPASAASLLADNFDGENGGASFLNYTGFANFTSTGAGGVDLVASPDFGIICAGSCVDLEGTPGPGEITSDIFAILAGQTVTLSFDIGGSQRGGGLNDYTATLFDSANNVLATLTETLADGDPFSTKSISYSALAGTNVYFTFSAPNSDNVGLLLDNVNLSTAVPEPSTWAMMILGLGLVGGAMRKRSKVAVRYA